MGRQSDVVADTPILSSWGNTLRDRSVVPFVSAAERASQWPAPLAGAMSWQGDLKALCVFDGTVWVAITPVAAELNVLGSTASSSYVDPSGTAGPVVSVSTDTKALVTVTANVTNDTAGNGGAMGFGITGATTVAATDTHALYINVVTAWQNFTASATFLVTGLTPGYNTFTAKYKRTGATGTASFNGREIVAVGVL